MQTTFDKAVNVFTFEGREYLKCKHVKFKSIEYNAVCLGAKDGNEEDEDDKTERFLFESDDKVEVM